MRLTRSASLCDRLVKIVVSSGLVVVFATCALAAPVKEVLIKASGAVTAQYLCTATELCREATVTGTVTGIGRFVGVFSDKVDITDGSYSGTSVITTPDGATFFTTVTG